MQTEQAVPIQANETPKLMAGIRSKDLSCKNKLGYPRLFASLSQQWGKTTLLDTCDGTLTLHDEKQAGMWKHTVWPQLPPNKWEKDQPNKHDDALITVLWDQLAKVDYFSPLLWRVDVYGNVLYRFADAGTPLSWSVDHLFPVARGGLTKAANLRIIQSQAHLNKADELEFLLTRNMLCTGLSMLDFKVQVKHSMEALLTKYGKQATALPVQATPPRGATLDRQHPSKSRGVSQQQGHSYSKEDVPLGLKATRVAHAAAVSSRVFSPSMRSPISGQVQPNALPSWHELADTLGFVQRQGSFHSEHAVQHLMTDQPPLQPSSRHLSKHASLPSQRSLHQRDSGDSHHRQGSMARHSHASDHQSQHSYESAPRTYSGSRHSQYSQGGYSLCPPLENSQIIAHSALFQTIPVSPRNAHTPTDQFEETDNSPRGLPPVDVASQHSYQDHRSSSYDQQQPHAVSYAQSPSSATAVARRDSYHSDRSKLQDYPSEPRYQSSLSAPAAVGTPPTAFQSADSFSSDMLSTDNNQTEQWDNSVLQRIQEDSEQAAAPASQQGAPAQSRLTDGVLQSVDSFASDALSTDMTQTAQWGKRLLSEMQQVAEGEQQQETSSHQEPTPAVHAVLDLNLEGMHPPTNHAEAGPHDWLWLPDELSTINDSDLSSIDGVRPDIDTWLAQQQASRLASAAQHGGNSSRRDPRLQQASRRAQHAQQGSSSFKSTDQLQKAVSPTSPLNTADSLDSIFGDPHQADPSQTSEPLPKAHSSLPWAENSTPPSYPYRYSPQSATTSHAGSPISSQEPLPTPGVFPQQSPEYTSPFAHWSSSPILGATAVQPDQAAFSNYDQQQQQQQGQTVPHSQSGKLQDHTYTMDDASAKQQELDDRLAALDTLEFPAEGDLFEGFEGFGSPVQTRHTSSRQDDSYGNQLYNTEAPLPVDAPGATLGAPEESLLASMREMLHGAADHQLADKQHPAASDTQALTADAPKPDFTSTGATADSISFHPRLAGRSPSAPTATPNSPGPVAPTTPDHTPTLPPCKVNPMSGFHSKRASQDPGREEEEDVLSSFQQLLGSRDGDQQDRLSKFRQLLASQEVADDGKPLSGLAGRVRTMASQLNALQKRTQELQLASSPSRRRSSPFSSRLSRAGSQTGSTQSLAALSSSSRRVRAEPSSPTSSLGRAAAHSPASSQGGALRGRGFHKSLGARATSDSERFPSYATGYRI